jgi:hypothetical protein
MGPQIHVGFNFVWTVDGQISIDEVEAEEVDVRAEFSCPYCYEEFDASALCVHIEDEHCFESKVAVSIINQALHCLQNLTWLHQYPFQFWTLLGGLQLMLVASDTYEIVWYIWF